MLSKLRDFLWAWVDVGLDRRGIGPTGDCVQVGTVLTCILDLHISHWVLIVRRSKYIFILLMGSDMRGVIIVVRLCEGGGLV